MAITLPQGDVIFLPQVPLEIKQVSTPLYDYVQANRNKLSEAFKGQFANSFTIATAFNAGTSGSFAITSGSTITVVNGIITNVV